MGKKGKTSKELSLTAIRIKKERESIKDLSQTKLAARRISRDVMRALNNQREDVSVILGCDTGDLAKDYEIEERYVKRLEQAQEFINAR